MRFFELTPVLVADALEILDVFRDTDTQSSSETQSDVYDSRPHGGRNDSEESSSFQISEQPSDSEDSDISTVAQSHSSSPRSIASSSIYDEPRVEDDDSHDNYEAWSQAYDNYLSHDEDEEVVDTDSEIYNDEGGELELEEESSAGFNDDDEADDLSDTSDSTLESFDLSDSYSSDSDDDFD